MKELTRPTLYRVMKYWGKKPHNIWGSYIAKYCPKNGVVLDPFVGSGMTYFESIKIGRTPITMDINPITDLTIKSLLNRKIDKGRLKESACNIIEVIKKQDYYKKEFLTKCNNCSESVVIYNYKRNSHDTITYKCQKCNKIVSDIIENYTDANYKIDKWIPTKKLSELESISTGFLKKIGEDNIASLWTNRNLKILSEIYFLILKEKDIDIRELLTFSFIQCLHLTSKMCIPRNDKSNRPLSTSWGRPAYMLSSKIFEQNPLLAFEKAVFNGSGIFKALKSSEEYLGTNNISKNAKHILGNSIIELKNIYDDSIDLVITDPPYGNIIQYGDLSEVWVSWLEKYNRDYVIDHNNEIIINKNKGYNRYEKDLTYIFKEVNRVLKKEGTFILTFNSNNNEDWKSLFSSIENSGFYVEKLLLQKNRRSSEANVGAKKGIAISDYYLICKSGNWNEKSISKFIKDRGIN